MRDRRSVFERLGPVEAERREELLVLAGAGGRAGGRVVTREPLAAAQAVAPPPGLSKRVSLSHPLVARQLLACQQDRQARTDSSSGGSGKCSSSRGPAAGLGTDQPPAVPAPQTLSQQRRQRRPRHHLPTSAAAQPENNAPVPQQQQAQQCSRGGSLNVAAGTSHRRQAASGGDSSDLHEQLRRLQAEREAADELMHQMAAQAQALLADKQQLQQQAAQLAQEKAQLEERLEYLLPAEDKDWAAGCGDEEEGGSSGSSNCQPATPSAASLGEGIAAALQGRLDQLAAERQLQLLALAEQPPLGSSAPSGPGWQ